MIEGFKHVKYCMECDEFGDHCEKHAYIPYEQWANNNEVRPSKFVCDHSYNIRWFRGSLSPEGRDGDYSRRGRCLECGSMILGVFKLAFARYQKPDGSDYVCDSENHLEEIDDTPTSDEIDLSAIETGWQNITNGFFNDNGSLEETEEQIPSELEDDFEGQTKTCVRCNNEYNRDDRMTGTSINAFFCRSCLTASLDRAGVFLTDPHTVNSSYEDCDVYDEFISRHWFEAFLESCGTFANSNYVEEVEHRYGISINYPHQLSEPYHSCNHCGGAITQVTTSFARDVVLRYDSDSYTGYERLDMITTCESCVNEADTATIDLYSNPTTYQEDEPRYH